MTVTTDISHSLDTNFGEVSCFTTNDTTQFKTDICADFFSWYQGFQPNFPRRNEFDIMDHFKKAPNIFLIKTLDDRKYEYRLQGETIVDLVGRRNKGKVFSSRDADDDLSRFARYLDEITLKRIAVRSYGNLKAYNREWIKFESIECPLVDSENNITHIIGVISSVVPA